VTLAFTLNNLKICFEERDRNRRERETDRESALFYNSPYPLKMRAYSGIPENKILYKEKNEGTTV
jgi:hypothetical protein